MFSEHTDRVILECLLGMMHYIHHNKFECQGLEMDYIHHNKFEYQGWRWTTVIIISSSTRSGDGLHS